MHFVNVSSCARMLRIIKIVTSKTYVQKTLILNGFFLLAQPPGEHKRTIVPLLKEQTKYKDRLVGYLCSN